MTGLEYGNARLRARRSRLLGPADYSILLSATSIDRLLGMLSETTYASAVTEALPRFRGVRRLDEALRRSLASELRAVQEFYAGVHVPALRLLLERWDLHNLRTILRAKAHPGEAGDLTAMLVPAGQLSETELGELSEQPGLRAVIDLMVAWGLPSRARARKLAAAWPRFERTGDVAVLEAVLTRQYAAHLDDVLSDEGDEADPGGLLRAEIDRANLMVALRRREAGVDGEPLAAAEGEEADSFLPGGRLRRSVLEAAGAAPNGADAAAVLMAAPLIPGWEEALAAWSIHGDLGRLEEALIEATTHHAVGLFRRGDPLGAAIPAAYVLAKENEVRNLRWIGRGIVQGLSSDELAAHLVVAA